MRVKRSAYIDRVEDGGIAVVIYPDKGQERLIKVGELPEGVAGGNWLVIEETGSGEVIKIIQDKVKEEIVRKEVMSVQERLRKRRKSKFKR